MREQTVRLERRRDRWRLGVRRTPAGAPAGAWLWLGDCQDQRTALRLWAALLVTDKRQ